MHRKSRRKYLDIPRTPLIRAIDKEFNDLYKQIRINK